LLLVISFLSEPNPLEIALAATCPDQKLIVLAAVANGTEDSARERTTSLATQTPTLTNQMTTVCAHIVASAGIWKTNVGRRRKDCLRVAPLVKP